MRLLLAAALALPLGGCVAQTALDIVTLPVKVASAGVDAVVTTQAESDRKVGRRIREQEECLGKEQRKASKDRREPDFSRCDKSARSG
jgi:ribosomal silencing factor RsfS